jgi:general secretion pathway protein K
MRRAQGSSSAAGGARERGIALLTAILVVALATIVAVAIAFGNAMTARRGAAVFAFDQSIHFAEGAEAIAAYALRQDSKDGKPTVDFAGNWAQPLGPLEVTPGVLLEAHLDDLQGRFNVNDLIGPDNQDRADAIEQLQQILQLLGLEAKWASIIADWIDADSLPRPDGAEDSLYLTQDPPYHTANQPINSVSELLALPGFGRDRFLKLEPHVTALPRGVTLNLCTASGVVLDSLSLNSLQVQFSRDPEGLAKLRANGCFPNSTQLESNFAAADLAKLRYRLGWKSDWFRLTSIVSIGTTEFNLYSLLHRESSGGGNAQVRVILRSASAD